MKTIDRFTLDNFKLKFAQSTSQSPLMISNFGPYLDSTEFDSVKILSNNNILGEKVKKAFSDGLSTTFGKSYNQIFHQNTTFETLTYKNENENEIFETFFSSADDRTFPIVLTDESSPIDYNSMYYKTKARFLSEGFPSQIIEYPTVRDFNTFKWSILPIYVQSFAKMGGVPWALDRGFMGVDPTQKILIIGMGFSYDPLSKRRGIGYVNIYDENGQWIHSESDHIEFEDSLSSIDVADKVSNSLTTVARRALGNLPNDHDTNVKLIIHYHGRELSRMEINLLEKLPVLENRRVEGISLVKLNDSNTIISDPSSPCKLNYSGASAWYPPVGLVIEMRDFYFLVTTGCFPESSPPKSNVLTGGTPHALSISFRDFLGSAPLTNEMDLLRSVFGLCRMNYRSLSNPVMRHPVSTGYAKEITYLTLRLKSAFPKKLSKLPWFL